MSLHVLSVALIGLVLCVLIFRLPLVYNYRLKNDAVEIVLFCSIPVYRLPLAKIKAIRKVRWPELGVSVLTILFITNRVFVKTVVLIEKRSGFPRRIAITPERPAEFVRLVTGSKA